MYFTREPIIESIVTPKEGYKLAVRNSKVAEQEEYYVDSLEIVSFGTSHFFRSTERPKAFLLPVTDYEILEVREARMALKTVAIDRGIKIGGGRDATLKAGREIAEKDLELTEEKQLLEVADAKVDGSDPMKTDRRKERRRYRKRRGRDEKTDAATDDLVEEEADTQEIPFLDQEVRDEITAYEDAVEKKPKIEGRNPSNVFSSLLPPPTTLISETISRYKDTPLFAGAFYSKEEKPEEIVRGEQEEVTPETTPDHEENDSNPDDNKQDQNDDQNDNKQDQNDDQNDNKQDQNDDQTL